MFALLRFNKYFSSSKSVFKQRSSLPQDVFLSRYQFWGNSSSYLYLTITLISLFCRTHCPFQIQEGPSWLWSYGSLIYNYLCNQCISPLTLWIRTPLRRGVLDATLCDKVYQWLAACLWFSPGTAVSPTKKAYRHDIAEMWLKVALNTITLTLTQIQEWR
jgi:hypothetical protein